jgi:fluoride exporter
VNAVTWIAVAGLGGLGSLLRFLVDGAVASRVGRVFPFGTLAVNLSGAVALGLIVGLAFSGNALLLVGTATIGSYTTFSTWMLESHRLTEDSDLRAALGNLVLSAALGIGAAALGRVIGMHL